MEQLPKLDFFNKIRSERFIVAAEMLGDLVYRKESRNPIFAIPIRAPSIEKRQFISEKLNENLIETGLLCLAQWVNSLSGFENMGVMANALVDEKGYVTNDPQLSDEKFMYMLELIKRYAN